MAVSKPKTFEYIRLQTLILVFCFLHDAVFLGNKAEYMYIFLYSIFFYEYLYTATERCYSAYNRIRLFESSLCYCLKQISTLRQEKLPFPCLKPKWWLKMETSLTSKR